MSAEIKKTTTKSGRADFILRNHCCSYGRQHNLWCWIQVYAKDGPLRLWRLLETWYGLDGTHYMRCMRERMLLRKPLICSFLCSLSNTLSWFLELLTIMLVSVALPLITSEAKQKAMRGRDKEFRLSPSELRCIKVKNSKRGEPKFCGSPRIAI